RLKNQNFRYDSPDAGGNAYAVYIDHVLYAETDSPEGTSVTTATLEGYEYIGEDDEEYFVPFDELDSLVTLEGGNAYTFTDAGTITYPPSSFLLQEGSIGPVYPTIPGAIVYDTQLQK